MASGHKTNLLAAAGKLKEIRLLHPEQLVCYAEMRGHKADVACMIFHPTRPTILFSGDSKASANRANYEIYLYSEVEITICVPRNNFLRLTHLVSHGHTKACCCQKMVCLLISLVRSSHLSKITSIKGK